MASQVIRGDIELGEVLQQHVLSSRGFRSRGRPLLTQGNLHALTENRPQYGLPDEGRDVVVIRDDFRVLDTVH